MSKIIFLKIKNIFLYEKHFKKQQQPHSKICSLKIKMITLKKLNHEITLTPTLN
jgi:hypothetical protein